MSSLIEREAQFYLDNDYTVGETASRLHICKSTLQKHFQKLSSMNPELYNQVRNKQMKSMEQGRTKGGILGKRTRSYTKEEAYKIAKIFIKNEYTLDELAKVTKIPRTTLHELLKSEFFDSETRTQIELVIQANVRKKTTPKLKREFDHKDKGIVC